VNLGADATEAESAQLADGNSHYFHIRSGDVAGNWCDTAVHIGPFWIDTTPPTLVTDLRSTSHEIETCSADAVVQLAWTSATDESSGLKGYWILWDTSPDTLPDGTVEIGPDVTIHASTELPDGKDHYFHIRSVDNVGNTLDEAVHIGPFYIDTTGPELVTDLQSTSHQTDVWSNDDTVDVQWTSPVDQCSGVDGYSIFWDGQSDTIPDEVKDVEEDATTATSPNLTDGTEFHFHIRGVDNLGNWSDEAAHLGPFLIDIHKPAEVTDLTSTPLPRVWISSKVVTVSWTAAQDNESGLDGYSIIWDTQPDTLPEEDVNLGADVTEAESGELADGDSHYFHIRSVDKVGNWCDTAAHIGPFYIDTISPTLSISALHPEPDAWTNENIVTVRADAADERSGLKGYSVVWDGNTDTEPDEIQDIEASETIESPELADGEWHVHARAVDNAGNWSVTARLGRFKIDTDSIQPPSNVESDTHVPEEWSSEKIVGVGWIPAVDDLSGLMGYSIMWDDQADTIPDAVPELEPDEVYTLSSELSDGGDHWFHICAIDNAGNRSAPVDLGWFGIDANPPKPVTDLVCTSGHEVGKWSTDNVLMFAWEPATDAGRGLDGYAVEIDRSSSTTPEIVNLDSSTTEWVSEPLDDGDKYHFHIRPVDKMGFWADSTTHDGHFMIDATTPDRPEPSTPHPLNVWSSERLVRVSWPVVADETSRLQGYSVSWDAPPDESIDLSSGQTSTSRELADGRHQFYIRAVDGAGNWSENSLGAFMIDTTPPHSVAIYRITEDSGGDYMDIKGDTLYYSGLQDAAFTVYVAGEDNVSGLKEARFQDCVGTGGIVEVESRDPNYSYSHQYETSKGAWFDGRCEITLYDDAENSATTDFRIFYDNIGPYKPVNVKCDDGATWNRTGEVKVTWEGEGDDGAGVVDYYVEADNDEPQANPSGGSMSATIAVDDGKSVTFYVRGLDNVGNWGEVGSAAIGVDTKAPGKVGELVHTDSDCPTPGRDNDGELEFSWQPATDNIKIDHYEAHVSEDDGEYKLHESVDEESCMVPGEDGHSYKLKVVAVDPAGNEGIATESEEVVCDTTKPDFVVGVLPTPVFRNFINIVIVSSEKLLEDSLTLSVKLAGAEKSVDLREIVENVWMGNHIIEGSGTATLIVSGTDLAGNEKIDKSNSFSAQTVLAGGPARVQSPDGELALNIPAGAFDKDTVVVITPVVLNEKLTRSLEKAQLAPGLSAGAVKPDELESIGSHYLISPDDAMLLSEATLTLQYEDSADVNKKHLGVYLWDGNASKWEYVNSLVDEKASSVSASVERFGIFGLHSDTKAPRISYISPPDGAVLDTSLPEFVIGVSDNGSGVDFSSLSVLIDGQVVSTSRKHKAPQLVGQASLPVLSGRMPDAPEYDLPDKPKEELTVLTLEHGLTAGDHTFSIVGEDMAGNTFASVRRRIHIPAWAVIPDSSQLLQNYPNPFNPETWIPYRLSESAHVRLSIYNISGRLIRTLELGSQKPGTYTGKERAIYWDGRDENGEAVSSGVYFYHLSAGTFAAVRKMVVTR